MSDQTTTPAPTTTPNPVELFERQLDTIAETQPDLVAEFREARNEMALVSRVVAQAFSARDESEAGHYAKTVRAQMLRVTLRWTRAREALRAVVESAAPRIIVVPQ